MIVFCGGATRYKTLRIFDISFDSIYLRYDMCRWHEIIRIYIISNSASLNISNFVIQNISNKLACISIKIKTQWVVLYPKKPSGKNGINKKPKQADNDNENENDNDNDNDNDNGNDINNISTSSSPIVRFYNADRRSRHFSLLTPHS